MNKPTHITIRMTPEFKEMATKKANGNLSGYIKGFLDSDVIESLEAFVDYYKNYEEVLNDELRAIIQKGKDSLNKAKS